jgi:tetratricopeptide (TPR) repeat protein
MSDIFISYASEDRTRVAPLVDALESAGWEVWWDRNIDGGAAWEREIESALDAAGCVVVVWSTQSVESDWVRTEAGEGLDRGVLVPVMIDDVRIPLAFRRRQTLDLTDLASGADELIAAVETLVPRSISAQSAAPFVGRVDELKHVRAQADTALKGEGRMVFIAGEAGVGKTRFVEEICATARGSGALVLTGRCQDSATALAFGPFLEQMQGCIEALDRNEFRLMLGDNAPELARLMPQLGQMYPDIVEPVSLSPEHERRYLLAGIGETLRRGSADRPLVLVFEDLHWADASTCALLEYLANHVQDVPVLLLGSYRSAEVEHNESFASLLTNLLRLRLVDDLHLDRFGVQHVGDLVQAYAGTTPPSDLVDFIHTQTEGNPFFIEETCRYLSESGKLRDADGRFVTVAEIGEMKVPRNVLLVIEQRLKRVSEACRQVLSIAAVIGREFNFGVLLEASDENDDGLVDIVEEGLHRALLRDSSTHFHARFQFAHELIRQSLLTNLSFIRRQRIHQRIAAAIEAVDGERIREIGHHLYLGGKSTDRPRVVTLLSQAGDTALSSSSFDEALTQFDRVLEVMTSDDSDGRAEIHRKRSKALRGLARIEDSLSALATGMVNAKDPQTSGRLLADRGWLYVDLYRGKEAQSDFAALLELATEQDDASMELDALEGMSRALYVLSLDTPGYAIEGLEASRRVVAAARKMGQDDCLVRMLVHIVWYVDYAPSFTDEAMAAAREALTIAQRIGDEEGVLAAHQRLQRFRGADPSISSISVDDLEAGLRKLRDPVRLNEHYFWMMWNSYQRSRFDKCVEVCSAGIRVADSIGVPPVMYATIRSLALAELARFEDALTSLQDEVTDADHRFGAAFQRHGEIQIWFQAGMEERALDIAFDVTRELAALNRPLFIAETLNQLARLTAVGRNAAQAAALLDEIVSETKSELSDVALSWLAFGKGDLDQAETFLKSFFGDRDNAERPIRHFRAEELGFRIAARRNNWPVALNCAEHGLDGSALWPNMRWRMLTFRGLARSHTGDSTGAQQDLNEARTTLEALVTQMCDEGMSNAYTSQDIARFLNQEVEAAQW